MYLVPGGVPGLGGCTWSWGEVYLVWGGVPTPGGCTWSRGSVPGPRGVYLVPGGCTWSGGCTLSGGCTWSQGGVPGPGGTWSGGCTWSRGGVPGPRGVYLVWGGCTWSRTPPVNRMTDACKNITLRQLRWGGKYWAWSRSRSSPVWIGHDQEVLSTDLQSVHRTVRSSQMSAPVCPSGPRCSSWLRPGPRFRPRWSRSAPLCFAHSSDFSCPGRVPSQPAATVCNLNGSFTRTSTSPFLWAARWSFLTDT